MVAAALLLSMFVAEHLLIVGLSAPLLLGNFVLQPGLCNIMTINSIINLSVFGFSKSMLITTDHVHYSLR